MVTGYHRILNWKNGGVGRKFCYLLTLNLHVHCCWSCQNVLTTRSSASRNHSPPLMTSWRRAAKAAAWLTNGKEKQRRQFSALNRNSAMCVVKPSEVSLRLHHIFDFLKLKCPIWKLYFFKKLLKAQYVESFKTSQKIEYGRGHHSTAVPLQWLIGHKSEAPINIKMSLYLTIIHHGLAEHTFIGFITVARRGPKWEQRLIVIGAV